ncbi:MAG TPA: N-acetyltransferase [Thermoanaerobaculia bacterium]|nr:N-acetyltransferase [Thermoanaerobaculia bacterium]
MIRPLAARDFDAVHAAFLEAFSDYVVPFALTREQLEEMLARRGWVPEASAGVFDDARLVAFTLNGIDAARAYDTGTGVVPTHRRRGLGRAMLAETYPLLRERGCTEYVLEVLEQNEPAGALYRNAGFVETRRFQCWRLEGGRPVRLPGADETSALHEEWWDIQPSWQNSTRSIERARLATHRELRNVAGGGEHDRVAVVIAEDLVMIATSTTATQASPHSSNTVAPYGSSGRSEMVYAL